MSVMRVFSEWLLIRMLVPLCHKAIGTNSGLTDDACVYLHP